MQIYMYHMYVHVQSMKGYHNASIFTVQGLVHTTQKPHLRNLFFRVSTFYRLGANLVFVIDGEATQLKWATLDRREERRRGRGGRGRTTGRRPQLQRYVTEVWQLTSDWLFIFAIQIIICTFIKLDIHVMCV